MRRSFARGALSAFFLLTISAGSLGVASAQGALTPWVSPDEIFRNGNQLLADLNALKCYNKKKLGDANRWQLSARPYFGNSPSMVQMSDALKKAELRVISLPDCVQTAQPAPRTPNELLQDSWSMANRASPADWLGFYVGGRVGGQRAESGWTTREIISINIVDPLEVGAANASPADTGFVGGGFIGYNFPLTNNFIAGVEVGLDIGGGEPTINGIPGIGAFLPGAVGQGDRISIDNKWSASIVGHLGVLLTPQIHAYGLFGYAWQRADVNFWCDETAGFCSAAPVAPSFSDSEKVTFSGPVTGLALEFTMGSGWVGRAEYRYASLSDRNVNLGDPATRSVTANLDQDIQSITLGLRYAFGAPPPPP